MNQLPRTGSFSSSSPLPAQLPGTEREARDRLIVALDVSDAQVARSLVAKLGDKVVFYKVGLELQYAGGLELASELAKEGKKIFLDTKLLDVDNTVERAVENIVYKIDATYITVHAYRHAISAAVRAKNAAGRDANKLKILCVTLLTSMDQRDLDLIAPGASLPRLVADRAAAACELHADGVIASGQEARLVRNRVGPDFTIITPAIRLPTDDPNEQKRVTTPREALENGADFLVVGRPITRSRDELDAVARVVANMLGA